MPEPRWPVSFESFVDWALYDPDTGFYTAGGKAGRGGDFITAPEVGPLFGGVVARALDSWWVAAGRPDPFIVVDAGAGPGTLGRSVRRARPGCSAAMRWIAVERCAPQRVTHPDGVVSAAELPMVAHVIIANELLDNLAFGLLVHDGQWREAWVDRSGGRLVEVLRTATVLPSGLPPQALHGARCPVQGAAAAWVVDARRRLAPGGRLVVFDYTSTTASMAGRPWREWLRTYRGHMRGDHYLTNAGSQDITADVAVDQLPRTDIVRTQAQWLSEFGIDDLVDAGRRVWAERAGIGDLVAIEARSRVREAEALCDPSGLGAHSVLEWSGSAF